MSWGVEYNKHINSKVSSTKAIIVYNKMLLLFLRDNDPDLVDPNTWSLVGGASEVGESHEETMKREMREEISVVPTNTKYLGGIKTPDGKTHAIYISIMTKNEVEQIQIGDEGQKVQFFKVEDVEGLDLASNTRVYFDIYKDYSKEVIEKGLEIDPSKLGLVP